MNMYMICLSFFLLNIEIAFLNSINDLLQWLCTLHNIVTFLTTPVQPLLSTVQRRNTVPSQSLAGESGSRASWSVLAFPQGVQMNYPDKNSQGIKRHLCHVKPQFYFDSVLTTKDKVYSSTSCIQQKTIPFCAMDLYWLRVVRTSALGIFWDHPSHSTVPSNARLKYHIW